MSGGAIRVAPVTSRNIAITPHILRSDAVAAAAAFIDEVSGHDDIACWLRPDAIAAVTPLPVSYTHLDVYKRQRGHCSASTSPHDRSGTDWVLAGSISVSYTHLDVYKRQTQTRRLPTAMPKLRVVVPPACP